MEFIVPVTKVPKLYMITDSNWQTDDNRQWGVKVGNVAVGEELKDGMCQIDKAKWLRAYTHHVIAAIMHPRDGGVLWECDGVVRHMDVCSRAYCLGLTTVRNRRMPMLSDETRIKFGFACAKAVYKNERFLGWVTDWLAGQDRSSEKAKDIAESCYEDMKSGCDKMDAKSRAAWSAQWMCWCCNIMVAEPDKKNTLYKWIGTAIGEAVFAAWQGGIQLDLIKVAETVMAAK